MATVDLTSFGHLNSVELATSTTLTLTGHSATVVNVTATATITLPAVAVGQYWIIRVGAEGITVTIDPNASDKIAGPGASNSGAGTDNKDLVFTNQPAGSFIELQYMSADGFNVVRSLGTFTYES